MSSGIGDESVWALVRACRVVEEERAAAIALRKLLAEASGAFGIAVCALGERQVRVHFGSALVERHTLVLQLVSSVLKEGASSAGSALVGRILASFAADAAEARVVSAVRIRAIGAFLHASLVQVVKVVRPVAARAIIVGAVRAGLAPRLAGHAHKCVLAVSFRRARCHADVLCGVQVFGVLALRADIHRIARVAVAHQLIAGGALLVLRVLHRCFWAEVRLNASAVVDGI